MEWIPSKIKKYKRIAFENNSDLSGRLNLISSFTFNYNCLIFMLLAGFNTGLRFLDLLCGHQTFYNYFFSNNIHADTLKFLEYNIFGSLRY